MVIFLIIFDNNRYYYRLIRKTIEVGKTRGEIKADISTGEIVKLYAMCERALMYDWCISGGEYSIKHYAKNILPMLFDDIMM